MFNDIWTSSAFGLVAMAKAINVMPRQAQDIADHVKFVEEAVRTNTFALDITTTGQIKLVPSSDLGGHGDLMEDFEHSDAVQFQIPYFVRRATLHNHEVMDARLPGANTLRILETERDKRYQRLRRMFDETKAHQRWTSLFGPVLDCNGKVLCNPAKQFGLQRQKMKLKLSDQGNEIDDQLVDAKEKIERILGFTPSGYKLITTQAGNQKLRKNKIYKEQATNPLHNYLSRQDNRSGIRFATDVEVIYFQSPHIDETKNVLVPIVDDLFRTVNGPSLSSQYWGNILPYYVTSKPIGHDEGIEFKGSMRTISYCTRPDAVFEVDIVD